MMLRPLRVEDVTDRYVAGINDPAVSRFLISATNGKMTRESICARVQADWTDPNAILFGIFVADVHCGNIRVHEITREQSQIGVAVFDVGKQRRGYGAIAIAAAADYVVNGLGSRRVVAGIDHRNEVSKKAFSRAGFRCVENDPCAEGSLWHYP
jgi:RimJ/RimL family protein N-acetyltransferase